MSIWTTWRALPALERTDMNAAWNVRHLPIVDQLVERILRAGMDLGRPRMKLEFETDHQGPVVRMLLDRHPRDGGVATQWTVRQDQTSKPLDDALARLSLMFARQDRILAELGEGGRFRTVDPAWSYQAHPILPALLRSAGVPAADFVRSLHDNGNFISSVPPLSKKTSVEDPHATMVDPRLGYLDGRAVGGDVTVSKIELGEQVFYRSHPPRLELRGIDMPLTMQAAVIGMRPIEIVDHPALEIEGLTIKGIRRIGGRLCLTIPAEPVPLAPGRPEGFDEPPAAIPLPTEAVAA